MTSQPAGLIRRLGALFYDWLLILALWFVLTALLLPLTGGEALPEQGPWHWAYQALLGLSALGFYLGFWRKGGQTLGMRAWRVRLVDEAGRTPSVHAMLVRAFWALPSWGLGGLGVLAMLLDPKRRALQDRLSGTRLIVDRIR
ncbi:MAG: RDD family protein [Gammaproteobacteria bacterium]|nr:RDD family protein [Gammaproteobacteria bacterium]